MGSLIRAVSFIHLTDAHSYVGGLKTYCLRAKELLLRSRHGLSTMEEYTNPEPPPCLVLDPSSEAMLDSERDG